MLDSDEVVDALRLARQSRRHQVFDVDEALLNIGRVLLHILVHLVGLEDSIHLLLAQRLARELLDQLAKVAERDSILLLDHFTREEFPLLLGQLLRNSVEEVVCGVFHYLLVQATIGRLVLIQGVLPAARVVTRLVLAAAHVLSEVDHLLGGDVQADSLPHILKAELPILVIVQPIEHFLHLFIRGDKAP